MCGRDFLALCCSCFATPCDRLHPPTGTRTFTIVLQLFRRYSGVLKGKTKDFDGITFAAFHQMLSDTNCYDLSFSQDAAAEAFSFSRSPLGEVCIFETLLFVLTIITRSKTMTMIYWQWLLLLLLLWLWPSSWYWLWWFWLWWWLWQ